MGHYCGHDYPQKTKLWKRGLYGWVLDSVLIAVLNLFVVPPEAREGSVKQAAITCAVLALTCRSHGMCATGHDMLSQAGTATMHCHAT